MTATIHAGDAIKWTWQYEGPRFHALLCDPPYELGFMGKDWDRSGVAFNPATWEAFYAILLPGAFGMAFASARGWHRLACAIEDAGFVIHPTIFGWSYGSGFPKATRIDTQIDKAAGAEQEIIRPKTYELRNDGGYSGGLNTTKPRSQSCAITAPATPLAQSWVGHRYGLQALKPALEPIIVFQRPYEGKPIDCITETGAGALWIDGGRVEGEYETRIADKPGSTSIFFGNTLGGGAFVPASGRWPANFLLLDDDAAAALDRQSGVLKSCVRISEDKDVPGSTYSLGRSGTTPRGHNDTGGASRFFFRVSEQIDEADPVRYCAKASRSERDAGLDGEPEIIKGSNFGNNGARPHTAPDYVYKGITHNPHPTVKPIALARYLATLLLPPSEYAPRRLFVPFAGVGSEMIGAHQAGWDIIEGVELEAESADIGGKRLDYWLSKAVQAELFT